VQDAINKAASLIEAMGYIRQFRGRQVVVKLGGSVLEESRLQNKILTDIAFMTTVGIQPVIVHGGGKAITKATDTAGIESSWVRGRRYTDERVLNIVEHTLIRQVNRALCEQLERLSVRPMGLHTLSSCVLFAEVLRLEATEGEKIDLGYVGRVNDVNSDLLKTLCQAETVPVIAPLALSRTGGKLNVNADSAAGMVAGSLKAEKLVVVSDTHGILRDLKDPSSRLSSANPEQIKQMIDSGVITEKMYPKVEACLSAVRAGVNKAHIIDGRIPHSLLLEIYTDKGVGTEILKD